MQQNRQESKAEFQQVDQQNMNKKLIIAKVLICAFALACVILVIFILSKSSVYFGYVFSLSTETTIKAYLKKYYQDYMAALYFSIFGFVICCTNTILFFFKFTQKDKLVWFHGAYFLGFFICGIKALTNQSYNDYMKLMSEGNYSSSACALLPLPQECQLSSVYLAYKADFTSFYISFIIFFVLYSVIYHYSVLKLLPFQQEQEIRQNQLKKQGEIQQNSSLMDVKKQKKNNTFVSEILDEFIYQQ